MLQAATESSKKGIIRKLSRGPFFWIAPLILVLLVTFVYPAFEVIRYSFTDASLTGKDYSYTLSSYIQIFSDKQIYTTLWTTFVFVFFSVVGQTVLGLAIALAIVKGEELRLRGTVFVRVVTLLAWAIPGVIIGVIWKIFLNESESGILTSMLNAVGINNVTFLTAAGSALVCTIVANIWRGTAQSMILSYSGLKTISKDILEAADIDGASAWQRLIHVTIPSILSVISINVILNIIATFNTFDMVMALTSGGPGNSTEILALSAYNQIFVHMNLGSGSAYATVLLLINGLMAAFYFWFLRRSSDNT
ncbi:MULTISPECIES: carbohydrate ABC transporter permease [Paenibacillus]|uniref:Sugar ABC transporter permease n=1 Tax=Paenibacillus lentus TaxID=1338368 RepID=A0A3S8RRQ0_9BACL|nr:MULTISPECIES: sugar ABC transporter permease [Paenibacillus]AZK45634.1 sugar ABC transporter permease [Paenibacillus lentus]